MPLRFVRLLPAACFPLLWASPLMAQTATPATPTAAESEEGGGGDLGPFDLSGSLEVGIGFDDNVYAQRNDKVSDGLWILSPEIGLSLEGEVVDLKLYGEAEIGRYWSESSEDYDDAELGASASIDLGEEREIFGGASYAWEHEDRSSPDAVNGLEPQRYRNPRAHLGYAAPFAPYEIRLGGTFERLDFDDVNAIPQPIDGDLRDRDLYTGGLRLGKDIGEGWQVFGQGYADFRNYDQEINAGGQDRDSEGGTLAAGLRYRVGKSLDFEVLGGLMYQSYDDPAFDSLLTPDIGAQLDWWAGRFTKVRAYLDRTLEETTAPDSPGTVTTSAGVTLSHLLRRDLSLYAGLDVIHDDYQDIDRDELTLLADAGLRQYLSPNFYLDFNYSFARRDSTLSAYDYDNHQFFFSLGAQLDPRYPEGATAGFAEPAGEGFYLGTQLPLGSLHSELAGPRGNGGTLTADFGDFGFGAGVFGGYGVSFDGWYLGLEVDGEWSEADWDHARLPGGRVFSVTKDWSLGAGPLAGYRLENGPLVYGRLGVVGTSFDTSYQTASGRSLGEEEEALGFRVGGGLEMPAGGGLFLRMDYSYTSYADYDISPPPGTDNFANSESLVRLGLGYRFGAGGEDEREAGPAYEPAGFYAGGQGGIASLFSEVTGPRSNNAGNSVLDADYGDEGLNLGLFGGWGESFERFYLGLEGEVEGGSAQPDLERLDEGRRFSVDKQFGLGLNLRLGYSLGEVGMVYLRGGPVWASFETDYAVGNSVSVSQSDDQLGWRGGLGLETPLDEDLFLRLDYSYTVYDGFDVAYGASGETDSFDNSESLFRVGVGWRF